MVRIRIRQALLRNFWGFAIATALILHLQALRATTLDVLQENDPRMADAASVDTQRRGKESNTKNNVSSSSSSHDWPGQPCSNLVHNKRTPLMRIGGDHEDNPVAGARDYVLQHLDEFLQVYSSRPDKSNLCGIRINHALMIYVVAKRLQPTTIIESGVNAGQSTYFFRQACPTAHIISLDPSTVPICGQSKRWIDTTNNEYLVGNVSFVDFNDVAWDQRKNVDPSNTLVFIDDHVGFFTRFPTFVKYGFRHVINEDNYKAGEGVTAGDKNNWTPKQMFRARSRHDDTVWLYHNLQIYAEFPPLLSPLQNMTHAKKKEGGLLHSSDDLRFMEEPLLRPDVNAGDRVILNKIAQQLNIDPNMVDSESYQEIMSYNYIAYMRVVPLAPRLAKEWNLTTTRT